MTVIVLSAVALASAFTTVVDGGRVAGFRDSDADMRAEPTTIDEPCRFGADDATDVKLRLVINSHVDYAPVLELLVGSLVEAGYTHFGDTVVVVGGCAEKQGPERGYKNMVFICSKHNSQDMNGLSMLYHYRDDPLTRADAYLYIHDSTKPFSNFQSIFENLKVNRNELQVPAVPHSNIFAFGRDYMCSYRNAFDQDLTKKDIIEMEFSDKIGNMGNSDSSITVTRLPARTRVGNKDIYSTGHPRVEVDYPYFGIHKFIFWGHHGNLTGNVAANLFQQSRARRAEELNDTIIEPPFFSLLTHLVQHKDTIVADADNGLLNGVGRRTIP